MVFVRMLPLAAFFLSCAGLEFESVSVDFDGETRQEGGESLSEIMPHWENDLEEPPEATQEDEEEDKSSGDFSFSFRQAVTGSTPTGPLGIGTPSINLNMILDTGSDKFVAKTWSTIKAELDKIDAGASEDVYPTSKIYNHNSSKSYIQLFASQHGRKVPRQGFIAYGSGMAVTLEGRETVRIGDGEKAVSMQKFPISEISLDSLQILHSSKGISGILGLQHMMNRSLGQSFYSVLRDKQVLHSFGYCRGKDNDGTFIWGDQSSEGKAVPVAGQMHWAVHVRNMHVQKPRHHSSFIERYEARISDEHTADAKNHSRLHKFSLCRKSHCVAVIDTGSNIIAMPSEAVRTLSKVLDVATDCSNMDRLPNLHFVLGEDMHVSLPPSAYIMKVKLPSLKQKSDDAKSSESTESEPSKESSTQDESEESEDAQSLPRMRAKPPGVLTETQQSQVDSLVEDTYREHGLDLQMLRVDLSQLLMNSSTLCMPAIVPLDRATQKGTLLVIGGPLFEKYYTRWSWPKGQKPRIYVKNLKQADACIPKDEEDDDDEEETEKTPKMTVWRSQKSPRMIRTEKPKRIAEVEMSSMPRLREMNLDEIRYPHWAKYIDEL